MKRAILIFSTLLFASCSHPNREFQKESALFQEEAESYYHLQRMIAKECAKRPSTKITEHYRFPALESLEIVKDKEGDLIGWTKIEKDPTGKFVGLCVTPIYNHKKKKLGYLIGKYHFQTTLKNANLAFIEHNPPSLFHERLKYSYAWTILSKDL